MMRRLYWHWAEPNVDFLNYWRIRLFELNEIQIILYDENIATHAEGASLSRYRLFQLTFCPCHEH